MKTILLTAFLFPVLAFAQRIDVDITVTFDLSYTPQKLYIAYKAEQRMDSIPFPPGKQWILKKQLPGSGEIHIYIADTIRPISLWADETPQRIKCRQELSITGRPQLVIQQIEGSKDALLYQKKFDQPYLTYISSPQYSKTQNDSIRGEQWRTIHIKYIDSTYDANSDSPILPFIVNFFRPSLGAAKAASFYNRLPDKVKTSIEGERLKEYLDRSVQLKIGNVFDDFTMNDDKGNAFRLGDLNAKYVLIDFWASSCGPCRYENRNSLPELYSQYKNKGFEIVAVSLDDDKEDWLKAIKQDKGTWLQVSDLKGDIGPLPAKYLISAVPYLLLIDSERRIIKSEIQPGQLRLLLAELFKD